MSAVGATFAIATSTLLECLRSRILLVSLAFALVLVALSISAASVSVFEHGRLIVDVGLAAASGLAGLIALLLSITSFSGGLKNRTAHPVLVRPIPRWAFVSGKFLGLWATMTLVVSSMVGTTAAAVWLYGESLPVAFWAAGLLSIVEMGVVCSVACFFSAMSSPAVAGIYAAGVWLSGNLAGDIAQLAQRFSREESSAAAMVLESVYYVLPDLQDLSLRTQAANHLPILDGALVSGMAYGVSYSFAVLVAATWVFGRRRTY